MDALIEFVLQQGAAVNAAPGAFVVALLVAAAVIVLFLNWLYGERLETQRTQIAFLSDQLREYKDKLQGASPAEAAKQIADLRGELGSAKTEVAMLVDWYQHHTTQRELTKEQEQTLCDVLDSIPDDQKKAIQVTSIADPEALAYATQILTVLKTVGICASQHHAGPAYPSSADEVGLLIVIPDEAKPLPVGAAVLDAFNRAGVQVKYDQYDGWGPPICCIMVAHKAPFQRRSGSIGKRN